MKKKKITEKYLIENDWKKWGRDDIPATVTFEKNGISIARRSYYKNGSVFGFSWSKKEENNPSSWEPLFEFKYTAELELFEKLLSTKH